MDDRKFQQSRMRPHPVPTDYIDVDLDPYKEIQDPKVRHILCEAAKTSRRERRRINSVVKKGKRKGLSDLQILQKARGE